MTVLKIEPSPTMTKVKTALNKMKNRKSPGPDEIPSELIKPGCETALISLHGLILKV